VKEASQIWSICWFNALLDRKTTWKKKSWFYQRPMITKHMFLSWVLRLSHLTKAVTVN
jgi:hypothetical protein